MGFVYACFVYTDSLGRLSPTNVTESSFSVVLVCSKTWKNSYLGRRICEKKKKKAEWSFSDLKFLGSAGADFRLRSVDAPCHLCNSRLNLSQADPQRGQRRTFYWGGKSDRFLRPHRTVSEEGLWLEGWNDSCGLWWAGVWVLAL